MKNELEIYIHIPFCIRKCAYCDFLSAPADMQTMGWYVDALIEEIRAYKEKEYRVSTIFFGGGTPSILMGNQIEELMQAIRESFQVSADAEITIETNPGTVRREKLAAYKRAGINRISFGLQSTCDESLKVLGRIHTYDDFLESYQLAREYGFDNINVDLISAIPGQSVASWKRDLKRIVVLRPEHISAYSLIVEDGTPFAELYGEGADREDELPTEDEERQMYWETKSILEEAGYERYEISNYAKAGFACKHNLGYWNRVDYLGLGLGAASLLDGVRFQNTDDLDYYILHAKHPEDLRCEREELSLTERMEEVVFLGLRKMEGVSIETVREQFGPVFEIRYGDNIKRMEAEGLIEITDEYFRLTEKGIDVSNYVFAEVLR